MSEKQYRPMQDHEVIQIGDIVNFNDGRGWLPADHLEGCHVEIFVMKFQRPAPPITCRKCGGQCNPSKGFHHGDAFIGEDQYMTVGAGRAELIDCLKCENCGHSFVPRTAFPAGGVLLPGNDGGEFMVGKDVKP